MVFSHLTRAEAVAFSEPLCRTSEFQSYRDGHFEDIYQPLGEVAAIGAAHSDGKDVAFNFALRANNDRPLSTAKTFIDTYHEVISRLRGQALGNPYATHNSDIAKLSLLETGRLYRLRTIAAFLLFHDTTHTKARPALLVVPRNVIVESGAAIAGLDTSSKSQSKRVSIEENKTLGFLAGITYMPSLHGARAAIDKHPDIAGFLHLKRGPRRARLKSEERNIAESKK